MPILGADMTSGTLTEWRKQPGDHVRRGDVIAEVETDKAIVEVEIFDEGVIETLLVEPGTEAPVGTPLAIIREEGRPSAAPLPVSPPPPAPSIAGELPPAAVPLHPSPPRREAGGRLSVSPAARRLAERLGVDLAAVTGSGPGGRIQERDVRALAVGASRGVATPAAAESPAPTQPAAPTGRAARMREAIAAAMARSNREIPHFHLLNPIDMTRALEWLRERNEQRPLSERLLYGVLLLKAVALALRAVPELNATWEGGHAVKKERINVGVAISLRGGGLVAPALHDTDRCDLDALMAQFRDLVTRARAGSLRSSELSDPTITVTSLGEQGVESVFGLIYPPQVALVGFGKIVERPWSVDGQIVSRRLINSTLAADHRVVDGHRGSAFLAAVDRLLQEPEKL